MPKPYMKSVRNTDITIVDNVKRKGYRRLKYVSVSQFCGIVQIIKLLKTSLEEAPENFNG